MIVLMNYSVNKACVYLHSAGKPAYEYSGDNNVDKILRVNMSDLSTKIEKVPAAWAGLAHYHPEIDCGVHVMMVLDDAAKYERSLEVRFAALGHDLGKATTPEDTLPRHIGHEQRSVDLLKGLCERLRVPSESRDLALLVAQYHSHVHKAKELRADTIVKLFDHCDLWRKPERFALILQTCESDAHGRTGHENDAYPQTAYLLACAKVQPGDDSPASLRIAEDWYSLTRHKHLRICLCNPARLDLHFSSAHPTLSILLSHRNNINNIARQYFQ